MQEAAIAGSGTGLHGAGNSLLSDTQADQTQIARLPTSPGRFHTCGKAVFSGQAPLGKGATRGAGNRCGAQVFKTCPAGQPLIQEVFQAVAV